MSTNETTEMTPADEAAYAAVYEGAHNTDHSMLRLKDGATCPRCVTTAKAAVAAASPWLALRLTPCCIDLGDAVPCNFDGNGEPCNTHERLYGHAEGEHNLCGKECAAGGSR